VLYAWEVPDRPSGRIAHLVPVFDDDGQIESHEYQITFSLSRSANCGTAHHGLREVDTDFDDSYDRYAVVTARPEPVGALARLP
jgi:hypothetical protein